MLAPARELGQRESDLAMRIDGVSSRMETPQGPAVSKRMRGNANGHKSKNNKPKMC